MKKEGLLYRVKNAASALFGGTKFTSAVILAGGWWCTPCLPLRRATM